MDYAAFLETLKQALTAHLKDGQELIIRPVPRNNGVLLDGLSIGSPDSTFSPTVYLDPYYDQYQEGMSIEAISMDILNLFSQNQPPECIDEDSLLNFDAMKPRIMMRLIHTDSNQELLSDIPHIPYLDLSIVFYLFLEQSASGQMTVLIHNELSNHWNQSPKKLLGLALKNTPLSYPAEVKSMSEVMKEIARQNLGSDFNEKYVDQIFDKEDQKAPLYVLSNQTGIYGACCMLYQNVLKSFAESLGNDLIIIPSSIHEVLLTPNAAGISHDFLNSMVTNVNGSEVPTEDQLSNHIYLYTRADDRIHIIVP